jgi:chromosome segregation ATPase
MSNNKQKPSQQQPQQRVRESASTPAEQVSKAEATLQALEDKRRQVVERAGEVEATRKRLSFSAHAAFDAEASAQLHDLRAEQVACDQEVTELDAAINEAKARLAQAQALLARHERRAELIEQRKRCAEVRQLGPFLDRGANDLRKGMLALSDNAAAVGKDHRHIGTLFRILQVMFFGGPLQEHIGVPDFNDKQSFSSFVKVIGAWCDSFDANLQGELARLDQLDGRSNTEAA